MRLSRALLHPPRRGWSAQGCAGRDTHFPSPGRSHNSAPFSPAEALALTFPLSLHRKEGNWWASLSQGEHEVK